MREKYDDLLDEHDNSVRKQVPPKSRVDDELDRGRNQNRVN